ncbi:hypothetical protein [Kitasatospora sp. NPDC058190]|uniref:hypothetical protein n=1 Tax=Kitasatospora sp. NPDC058190 TaxID=3346371 RepID=UPI0036DC2335
MAAFVLLSSKGMPVAVHLPVVFGCAMASGMLVAGPLAARVGRRVPARQTEDAARRERAHRPEDSGRRPGLLGTAWSPLSHRVEAAVSALRPTAPIVLVTG